VALIALVAAIAAPSAAAGRDRCAPRGAKTVKQTSQVRVFTQTRRRASTYYACLRGSGRRPVEVATAFDDPESESIERVTRVLVAGTSVAVESTDFDDLGPDGSESASLVVADLRRGGRFFGVTIDTTDGLYAGFTKVLLRADGAAAWTLAGNGDYDEVDVLGADDERATPVAYAKGIDPRSLRFGGDGVTWLQDGITRTAAIP
jgi:hypothetical protein